jgi:hypothetical protein
MFSGLCPAARLHRAWNEVSGAQLTTIGPATYAPLVDCRVGMRVLSVNWFVTLPSPGPGRPAPEQVATKEPFP